MLIHHIPHHCDRNFIQQIASEKLGQLLDSLVVPLVPRTSWSSALKGQIALVL